jgi:hypothetical protein
MEVPELWIGKDVEVSCSTDLNELYNNSVEEKQENISQSNQGDHDKIIKNIYL